MSDERSSSTSGVGGVGGVGGLVGVSRGVSRVVCVSRVSDVLVGFLGVCKV